MFFLRKNKPKKKQYVVTPEIASDKCIGQSCTICGTGILSNEQVVFCPCCNLPYHHECWEENGGCGSYGCDAAPEVEKTETLSEDTYVDGWTTDKICPACGSLIKSNALICKNCKAKFPTEKPMTKTQWLNRPYEGSELDVIRLIIIIQFIATAFGIFTLIMAPLNYITYSSGKWPYNFKRLPSELKLLNYASNFVGIMWIILCIISIFLNIILK